MVATIWTAQRFVQAWQSGREFIMQFVRRVLAFLLSMGLTLATGLGLVRAAGGPAGQEVSTTTQGGLARSDQAATSGNQSDLDIAAAIRRILVQDDALSRNGHDVKVTTHGGVVTLRGPVDSPAEKSKIDQLAHQIRGIRQIDNQWEVSTGGQADVRE